MQIWLGFSAGTLRFSIFLGLFAVLIIAERMRPRRKNLFGRLIRWPTNLGVGASSLVIVKLIETLAPALAAIAAARFAETQGFGILHWLALDGIAGGAIAIIVLDFGIYLQHVASHKVPVFWRMHRVHHADRDFDVTTALRFHPFEIALSTLYKIALVLALGASPAAVLLFEILLNGLAMFNHANLALPLPLDRIVRALIVTPDMHRIHHSTIPREHNSNFGFNLSLWDRLFRTYRPEPEAGQLGMTIGLPDHQDEQPTGLRWSLLFPFK